MLRMKSRGLSCLIIVLLIAACGWLLLDLLVLKGPLYAWLERGRGELVAEVSGHPISRLDLEEAIRAHLWTGGISWQSLSPGEQQSTRSLVLEKLTDDRLVRAARLKEELTAKAPLAAVRRELEMLRRQFSDPADYAGRLAVQYQTQKSLDASVLEAQMDEAWLAEKIAPRIKAITEKEVRAWYEVNKETLRIPQTYHAAHIFLAGGGDNKSRAAEIRQIHDRLSANEKAFAAIAVAGSEDARTKAQGGDLGWFSRQRMPADFIVAVEKLKPGQLSAPVSTRLGWHIIRLVDRRPSRLPSFAEVRHEIAALLTTRHRENAIKELLATLRQVSPSPIVFR